MARTRNGIGGGDRRACIDGAENAPGLSRRTRDLRRSLIAANSVTSACNILQDVKVFCVAGTPGASSTHFVLDVFGYYL